MRKQSLWLLLAALWLSCSKNSGSDDHQPLVLYKEYEDGKLLREYGYTGGNMTKLIEYYLTSGKIYYTEEFIYDTKNRLESTRYYNYNGELKSMYKYYTDSKGRFTFSEYIPLTGSDSGKVTSKRAFTYNAQGLIEKESVVDKLTLKPTSYRSYQYHANGNLKAYQYFGVLSPSPQLSWEADYTDGGNSLPEQINRNKGYPINFLMIYFTSTIFHFKSYTGTANEFKETISERVFNDQDLLTSMKVTRKHLSPVKPDDEWTMTYEYKPL